MSDDFRGLVLRQDGDTVTAAIEQLHCEQLPPGDVLVQVAHSSLNYKDGMVLGGIGRLVRTYPHVGGIDFAGTVAASTDPRWPVGKKVILTGWRVGEMRWGGYAEYARVTGDMLVALPDGLTTRQAMAIGTAGFTSMLAILALEGLGIGPDAGDVLVTGASGGVGSVAATVLARLGYRVVASSGRPESAEYLRSLGVAEIVPRDVLAKPPARPLDSERWAGCVDAVGGATLSTVLTQMKYRGAVAACGLAGGAELQTTVIPFLLRGVNLLGIDSVMCPNPLRQNAWRRLAKDLPLDLLESMIHEISLEQLPEYGRKILAGQTRGRVVVTL
jgi:acrylyl-CoA reductase (NADPH)